MMMTDVIRLGAQDVEAAVLGGAILGGGGGGSMKEGLRLGYEALKAGAPSLVPLASLPDDTLVATASLVGAPAARDAIVEQRDYVRAWELLAAWTDAPIGGVISSENGGTATVNGWLQSAVFGIPVVDAPADGRAHPTADMGVMGLERERGFVSFQAVAGGSKAHGLYMEQQVRGALGLANRLVRTAADAAGGLVAVARNPVAASYLRERAAVGAISQALALGRLVRAAVPHGAGAVIEALAAGLGARIIAEGAVTALDLSTEGGYDVGFARVADVEVSIWNEYLTLERDGCRVATFPDLTVTIALDSGLPVTSAELSIGRRVAVLAAPAERLVLGAGLRIAENFHPLEDAVGREILPYVRYFADVN
ncbi:MAG: DUF917 family protein [Acidobacteria bacterium]|nr:MAG: DUF917 family protein [Acidobacteriota bacterium]RPJ83287.1 MAG: DUF917 family protein [Acidobacteriota bacterium]